MELKNCYWVPTVSSAPFRILISSTFLKYNCFPGNRPKSCQRNWFGNRTIIHNFFTSYQSKYVKIGFKLFWNEFMRKCNQCVQMSKWNVLTRNVLGTSCVSKFLNLFTLSVMVSKTSSTRSSSHIYFFLLTHSVVMLNHARRIFSMPVICLLPLNARSDNIMTTFFCKSEHVKWENSLNWSILLVNTDGYTSPDVPRKNKLATKSDARVLIVYSYDGYNGIENKVQREWNGWTKDNERNVFSIERCCRMLLHHSISVLQVKWLIQMIVWYFPSMLFTHKCEHIIRRKTTLLFHFCLFFPFDF